MQIKANRLDRGFLKYQTEFEDKALEVLRSGWYVLGKEVSALEQEFAEEVLSIPIYSGMTKEEQDWVIEVINGYKGA